uniref:toll-like receptor 21 n=1 Tax=Pristiophorus japonicus TaxID=55135 RepID=UPI00398E70B4
MVPCAGREMARVLLMLLVLGEMRPVRCLAFKKCIGHYFQKDSFTCTDMNISRLEDAVSDIPTNIRVLNISFNWIRSLPPKGLGNLTHLEDLRLDNNQLTTIDPEAFWNLSKLRLLNLSCNHLKSLNLSIFNMLPNLTSLILRHNRVAEISAESISPWKMLHLVDISYNALRNISSFITALGNLSSLRILNAQNTSLSSLEITSHFPPNLTHLLLANNSISELRTPPAFFANIVHLDLSYNRLARAEDLTLLDLPRLHSLNIQGNPLKQDEVLKAVQNLNAPLTNITLSHLQLKDLGTLQNLCEAFRQKGIHTVWLMANGLQRVSAAFTQCYTVESLDLSYNRIKKPDLFTCQGKRSNLQALNLDHNIIRDVSLCDWRPGLSQDNGSIPCLEQLRYLSFKSNHISAIRSHAFQYLINLEYLSLAINEINFINVSAFAGLTNLKHLSLTNNAIGEVFHKTFTPLQHLEVLKIRNNRIPIVYSPTYSSLTNLTTLDLGGNHIQNIKKGGFTGLRSLINLYLDRNWLPDIRAEMFEDLKSLEVLDIANNKLSFHCTHLKSPPFVHLHKLRMLKLQSQEFGLKMLPHNLFKGLEQLKTLDISNNKFVTLNTLPFHLLTHLEQLYMSNICNGVQTMHNLTFANLANLQVLFLENVGLESIRKTLFQNLTNLTTLVLRSNMIRVIREQDIPLLHNLHFLDLNFNPVACVCDNLWFQQWSRYSRVQVVRFYQYQCEVEKTKLFAEFDSSVCNDGFVAFCATAPIIFVLILMAVIYQKGKWNIHYGYYLLRAWIHEYKLQRGSSKDYQYDAFVSYNSKDEDWVFDQLLHKLEKEGPPYHQLCFHHRDFEVGKPIVENIVDAIYKSRKTICVISKNYLHSEWCSMEMQVAMYRLIDEHSDVLILVFLDEIPGHVLSSYHHLRKLVRKKTYINWPADEAGQKLFWTKLRDALKKAHPPSEEKIHCLTQYTS